MTTFFRQKNEKIAKYALTQKPNISRQSANKITIVTLKRVFLKFGVVIECVHIMR